jgi:hypothetical protein
VSGGVISRVLLLSRQQQVILLVLLSLALAAAQIPGPDFSGRYRVVACGPSTSCSTFWPSADTIDTYINFTLPLQQVSFFKEHNGPWTGTGSVNFTSGQVLFDGIYADAVGVIEPFGLTMSIRLFQVGKPGGPIPGVTGQYELVCASGPCLTSEFSSPEMHKLRFG